MLLLSLNEAVLYTTVPEEQPSQKVLPEEYFAVKMRKAPQFCKNCDSGSWLYQPQRPNQCQSTQDFKRVLHFPNPSL